MPMLINWEELRPLVRAVKRYPFLYDRNHKYFRNIDKKLDTYHKIIAENVDLKELTAEEAKLYFDKCRQKFLLEKKTRSCETDSKWVLFDDCSYLDTAKCPTETSRLSEEENGHPDYDNVPCNASATKQTRVASSQSSIDELSATSSKRPRLGYSILDWEIPRSIDWEELRPLIKAVKQYPLLYDKKHKEFRNKEKKLDIYRQIIAENDSLSEFTPEEAKTDFEKCRQKFRVEKRLNGVDDISDWLLFDECSYLNDYMYWEEERFYLKDAKYTGRVSYTAPGAAQPSTTVPQTQITAPSQKRTGTSKSQTVESQTKTDTPRISELECQTSVSPKPPTVPKHLFVVTKKRSLTKAERALTAEDEDMLWAVSLGKGLKNIQYEQRQLFKAEVQLKLARLYEELIQPNMDEQENEYLSVEEDDYLPF